VKAKALVLAAALSATNIQPEPAAKRPRSNDTNRRHHAERPRFTPQDLDEMFGDMDPTPDEPAPALALPEPDFIAWEPREEPVLEPLAEERSVGHASPLAA
jgi:hypothetical protein